MKCFTHQDADAVAICKSCGRGVCPTCATMAGEGIACGPRCASEVAQLHGWVAKSGKRMRATHTTQAVAFTVLCLAAAFSAIIADGVGRGVMLSAAALLLLLALRYYRLAALWRDSPE